MAEITAALVKELREKTVAGMMDCKRALAENNGEMEPSVDWLRKKGLAAAAKKAGRVAAEGLVGVLTEGRVGAVVEVNSETDFVARNDKFQGFVAGVTRVVLDKGESLDAIKAASLPGHEGSVDTALTQLIATIGENMSLRRARRLAVAEGVVIGYVHNATAPGLGKIGVLVALESPADTDPLAVLAKQLAMHVAAAAPHALDVGSLDPAAVERERAILTEKAQAEGKPAERIPGIVEGQIRKYHQQVALLEQIYVIDGKTKVAAVVEQAAKGAGKPIKLAGFVRFALGEGIDKGESDFASEVAAARG